MSTDPDASHTQDVTNSFAFDSLESVRKKLLDLSGKNSLLNYKHPKASCIRLIDELPDQLVEQFQKGIALTFIPVPEPTERELIKAGYIKINAETKETVVNGHPTSEQWAKYIGFETAYDLPEKSVAVQGLDYHQDNDMQTLMYAPELEARLRNLRNKAETAIEEGGANILYLGVGFLEWIENQNSDIKRLSPLFTVPVKLDRATQAGHDGAYRYSITMKDDGLITNVTLREKLANIINQKQLKSIETYIEENKIPDIEFLRRVLNDELHLLCWMNDFPCCTYIPYYKDKPEDPSVVVFVHRPRNNYYSGLFYIHKLDAQAIINNGSGELKHSVCKTNHAHQSHQVKPRYIKPPENPDNFGLVTLFTVNRAIMKGEFTDKIKFAVEFLLESPLPSELLADSHNGNNTDTARLAKDTAIQAVGKILSNRHTPKSWLEFFSVVGKSYQRDENLDNFVNNQFINENWAVHTPKRGVSNLDSIIDSEYSTPTLVTLEPPYTAKRTDLVIAEDIDSYLNLHAPSDNEISYSTEDINMGSSATTSENGYIQLTERYKKFLAILNRLTPRQRDVFLLNRYEGCTYRQIADRYGLSISAVEKHMMKALKSFKQNLCL